MTTIIGKNDVGKSTLLMALDLFFSARQVQPSDFFKNVVAAPIVVRITFDSLSLDLIAKVPNYLDQEKNLTIEKRFLLGAKPEEFYYKEDFVSEELREIENKDQDELNTLVHKLNATVVPTGVRPTNEDKRKAILDLLRVRNEPKGFFAVKPAAEAKVQIEREIPSFYLYPADSSLSTGQASFQNYFAPVIKLILDDEKKTFDKIEGKIKAKLDENVRTLTTIVQEHNSTVKDLRVTSKYQWDGGIRHELEIIDILDYAQLFQHRGFGLRRTVMLSVFRLLQNLVTKTEEDLESKSFKQVLCIEEPEIYLHPGAQRQLFHSFHSLSESGIQIVITTHSTIFVDRILAGNVLLLQRESDAQTMSHNITDNHQFEILKEELGVRSSDVFFANCVVLVEGETEEAAFPSFFKTLYGKTFDEFGIKIINLRGKTKSVDFLKAINEMNVPRTLVVDKDAETDGKRGDAHKPSMLQRAGLIAADCCFIHEQGEFEDALPVALLSRALQRAYPDYNEIGEEWLEGVKSDCHESGKKLSEELNKHLYCFEGRCDKYDKVQVGRLIGELAIADEIPQAIQDCLKKSVELSK
jgi:predicted ATP-dependent endonuclease of OLD family